MADLVAGSGVIFPQWNQTGAKKEFFEIPIIPTNPVASSDEQKNPVGCD